MKNSKSIINLLKKTTTSYLEGGIWRTGDKCVITCNNSIINLQKQRPFVRMAQIVQEAYEVKRKKSMINSEIGLAYAIHSRDNSKTLEIM